MITLEQAPSIEFWEAMTGYLDNDRSKERDTPMTTQLYTPKLELSGLADATGEVLRFAFRGETITEALRDETLDSLLGWMKPWQATFKDSAEVWTIYAGPAIEREDILPLLPNCKKLEREVV